MTFLKCLCCCSNDSAEKRTRLPTHKKQEITEESGCYLTYEDSHVYVQWSYSTPTEGVLIFAKSTSKVPENKISKYKTDLGAPISSEHFFKLIVEFLKEVAPYKPVLFISSQADNIAYTPFLMLIHSEGNGIIGGRVKTLAASQKMTYHENIDCIGIMKLPESPLKLPNQDIDEFLNNCTNFEAVTLKLDAAGKIPSI